MKYCAHSSKQIPYSWLFSQVAMCHTVTVNTDYFCECLLTCENSEN